MCPGVRIIRLDKQLIMRSCDEVSFQDRKCHNTVNTITNKGGSRSKEFFECLVLGKLMALSLCDRWGTFEKSCNL